jgi:hypothetical protein
VGGNAAAAYANLKASGMYGELKKAGMLTEEVLACEAHDKAVADANATDSITYPDHPLPCWCEKHGPRYVVVDTKKDDGYTCTACDTIPSDRITVVLGDAAKNAILRAEGIGHSAAVKVAMPDGDFHLSVLRLSANQHDAIGYELV